MSSLSFCCLRGHSSTRTTRGKLGWEEELRERDGVMIYSIVWEHTAGAVLQNERLAGRAWASSKGKKLSLSLLGHHTHCEWDIQWRYHCCVQMGEEWGGESCIPLDNWVILGEPACREAEQLEAGRQHLLLLSKCVYLQSSQRCLWLSKGVNLIGLKPLVDNYSLLLLSPLPMPSCPAYETEFTGYKWMQCYA